MRVVSLLPAATEILYALGVEPVATSHECDYPPAARDLPSANRSRVDGESSVEINQQVASAEASGGVYELKPDVLRTADPGLVIAQGICDVCAIDGTLVADALDELGLDADILSLHSHRLDGVIEDVRRVGAAIDREERAADLVADLRDRIAAVDRRAPDGGPQVAVLDWMEPVMVAGHWVPELVEIAGCEYGMADPGDRSSPREWDSVLAYDPDVLVAAPCGFTTDETVASFGDLANRPGWSDLSAAREGRVFAVDGHHHVNRPGPRIVETLEILAGLLHPDEFESPASDVARRMTGATRA